MDASPHLIRQRSPAQSTKPSTPPAEEKTEPSQSHYRRRVIEILNEKYGTGTIPAVEDVQDVVERALVENGQAKVAKAYIIYRQKRRDSVAKSNEFSRRRLLTRLTRYST